MNYNDETLLEMVELYAESQFFIASEDELSERFDSMLAECYPDFDTEDEDAINQTFNNWSDGLCKDGEIHPIQYSEYGYVGEHAPRKA